MAPISRGFGGRHRDGIDLEQIDFCPLTLPYNGNL
jgi:hypothetical protein